MRLRSHMLERFKSLMNCVHLLTQSESESLQRGRSTFRERTYSVTHKLKYMQTPKEQPQTHVRKPPEHMDGSECAPFQCECVRAYGLVLILHSSEQNSSQHLH